MYNICFQSVDNFQIDQNYVSVQGEINNTKTLLHQEDAKLTRNLVEVNGTLNAKVR